MTDELDIAVEALRKIALHPDGSGRIIAARALRAIKDNSAPEGQEMTPVRSLDIRPGEAWTPGRLPFHIALATLNNTALPKPPKRRPRLLHYIAWAYLMPSGAALATIAALKLLIWGLR
jgi:hypothetical protein